MLGLRLGLGLNVTPGGTPTPTLPATQTVAFRNKTLDGHGGHDLGAVNVGTLTITGGVNASHWTIDANNHLVPNGAGAYGTAGPAYAFPYNLTIEDVANGLSSTVTINDAGSGMTVRSLASDTSSNFQLKKALFSTALVAGDTVTIRDGSVINPSQGSWSVERPYASELTDYVTIEPETALGATIQRVILYGGLTSGTTYAPALHFHFKNILFHRPYSVPVAGGDIGACVEVGGSAGINNVRFTGNEFKSLADNVRMEMSDITGSELSNAASGFYTNNASVHSIEFYDNYFHDLATGVCVQGANIKFIGNTVRRWHIDGFQLGNSYNVEINWNLFIDGRFPDLIDGNWDDFPLARPHHDFIQFGQTSLTTGSYAFGDMIGNVFARGDANDGYETGQCIFMGGTPVDVTYNSARFLGNFGISNMAKGIGVENMESDALFGWNAMLTDTSYVNNDVSIILYRCDAPQVVGNATYSISEESPVNAAVQNSNVPGLNTLLEYAGAFFNPVSGASNTGLAQMMTDWAMKAAGTLDKAFTGNDYHAGAFGTGYIDHEARTYSFPDLAWEPTELFAATEEGGWWDPSDTATLWQDTAGTTAVTTAGQSVARIDDKSGNGHHLTQATLANRPTYEVDVDGNGYLNFDGTNDYLSNTDAGLRITGDLFLAGAWRRDTGSRFDMLMSCQTNVSTVNQYEWNTNNGAAATNMTFRAADGASAQATNSASTVPLAANFVATAERTGTNIVFGSNSTEDIAVHSKAPTSDASSEFRLASRKGTPFYFDGRCYGAVVIDRELTEDEELSLRTFLASKATVTL